MKVTSYAPVFYAKDVEIKLKRYQDVLGLELLHQPKTNRFDLYVLGAEDGTRINIIHSDNPAFSNMEDGFIGMRVNVDDFDEGVAFFKEQGFTEAAPVDDTESFKAIVLNMSGSDSVVVFYHKK